MTLARAYIQSIEKKKPQKSLSLEKVNQKKKKNGKPREYGKHMCNIRIIRRHMHVCEITLET